MAIKLIIPGKLPSEKPLRGDCRNCGAVYEFTVGDARCVHDRDGDLYEITCQVEKCRGTVYGSSRKYSDAHNFDR